jgi:hypothetical protein
VDPDLEHLLRQLEAVKAEGSALAAGLTQEQFNWRPAPERWSIAECLDHLNVAVTRTLPAFDTAIATGRRERLVGRGPHRYGWVWRLFVWSMEPPPRMKLKRPEVFVAPRGEHAAAALLPRFISVRDQLGERVRQADGLDLARVRITSPAYRLLRVPLGAYFAFILAHERRHLWQARQVRASAGFPGA